ncbi:hypothetical protein CPB84DRAFT_1829873 [Gymnopilus junonius]|uniref:CRESS-DNA virus Rep endonuclease domain-containing protein n=1 Tax=Gymnopilus junonius TaxID=109634 RepID=A0A9P5N7J5_GYMJU|nr:hypothetical protein CPB84DRAFT_1829873 [Gymnopilus junonius]
MSCNRTPRPSHRRATRPYEHIMVLDPLASQGEAMQGPTQEDSNIPGEDLQGDFITHQRQGATKFRFSAKTYFLTYSQIGDHSWAMLEAVFNRMNKRPKWWAVKEQHADGGWHWHVLVVFDTVYRGKNPHVWDVDGIHPNIKIVTRSYGVDRVAAYMRKTGNPDSSGNWCPPIVDENNMPKQKKWAYIADSKDDEEFNARLRVHAPYEMINNHTTLKAYSKDKFAAKSQPYKSKWKKEDFPNVPRVLKDWVNKYVEGEPGDRPKTLCLWGPTHTGKTQWARSLGHHAYMNLTFNSDKLKDETGNKYKAFFGAQEEIEVTDKYRPKSTLHWGKPLIWLSNEDPELDPNFDQQWLKGNCIFYYLDYKLYESSEDQ